MLFGHFLGTNRVKWRETRHCSINLFDSVIWKMNLRELCSPLFTLFLLFLHHPENFAVFIVADMLVDYLLTRWVISELSQLICLSTASHSSPHQSDFALCMTMLPNLIIDLLVYIKRTLYTSVMIVLRHWLLLRGEVLQSVPWTAAIYWCIMRPHLSSNHSCFIHQSSLAN